MPSLISNAFANLGTGYLHVSQQLHPKMVEVHEKALAAMDKPLGQVYAAMDYCELGFGALAIDKPERALELFELGRTTRSAPIRICTPHLYVGSTLAHLALRQHDAAQETAKQAHATAEEATMTMYGPWLAWMDAHLAAGLGQPSAAEMFDRAEQTFREAGMMHYVWQSALRASTEYARSGNPEKVDARLQAAEDVAKEILAGVNDPGLQELFKKDVEKKRRAAVA